MNYLPSIQRESDYDGFYIDNSAIYVRGDAEKDWNAFVSQICRSIRLRQPGFKAAMCWKPSAAGHSLYTLLESNMYDITVETEDEYTAVFLIVSSSCKNQNVARKCLPRYAGYLQKILLDLYPCHVRKRRGRKTELVD